MPDEEKKTVDIDTSGPDATDRYRRNERRVCSRTARRTHGTRNKTEEPVEEKKQDENLEDYSKGVQARIAKLTRKMREAERREQAALDYAKGVEEKERQLEARFEKTDSDYIKKFETTISSGSGSCTKRTSCSN